MQPLLQTHQWRAHIIKNLAIIRTLKLLQTWTGKLVKGSLRVSLEKDLQNIHSLKLIWQWNNWIRMMVGNDQYQANMRLSSMRKGINKDSEVVLNDSHLLHHYHMIGIQHRVAKIHHRLGLEWKWNNNRGLEATYRLMIWTLWENIIPKTSQWVKKALVMGLYPNKEGFQISLTKIQLSSYTREWNLLQDQAIMIQLYYHHPGLSIDHSNQLNLHNPRIIKLKSLDYLNYIPSQLTKIDFHLQRSNLKAKVSYKITSNMMNSQ